MGNKNEQELLPLYQNSDTLPNCSGPEQAGNNRRKILLATILGVLVLNGSAEAAPPLQYVAVVENELWTPDQQKAYKVAAQIKDAGFNSVRVVVPITPGQAEINNDKNRICNAARAAEKEDLTLFITTQGFKKDENGKFKVGYAPHTPSEITQYITALSTYMWTLSGPMRCTNKPHDLNVQIMNEPNIDTFWEPQFDAQGNWIAPRDYVRLLARVHPALNREAAKISKAINSEVQVDSIAGALTSRNALNFIYEMGKAKSQLGLKGPLFHTWSEHPYGRNWSEPPSVAHPDGSYLGISDYKMLTEALKEAFGKVPPIIYGEYAVETSIPPEKQVFYSGKVPDSVTTVDEATQARFYHEALSLTACQPKVKGLFLFHLIDDPNLDRWQTGLFYTDGSEKSSLKEVRQSALAARAGTIATCGPSGSSTPIGSAPDPEELTIFSTSWKG